MKSSTTLRELFDYGAQKQMLKKIDRPCVWGVLSFGLTMLILWLSLLPADSVPPVGLGWDKLNHATAIATVTLFTYLTFKSRRWAAQAAFLYGISLGILIEVCQATFTTTRTAEWGDVLADLIGAGLVWCLIFVIQLKRGRS
jgi:VanZ family protein